MVWYGYMYSQVPCIMGKATTHKPASSSTENSCILYIAKLMRGDACGLDLCGCMVSSQPPNINWWGVA